jgi:hypothetical protein
MIKLRHATMSFNFKKPGETFEVDADEVDKLIDRYGCELVEGPFDRKEFLKEVAESKPEAKPKIKKIKDLDVTDTGEVTEGTDKEIYEVMMRPIETSPGWWLYDGKKYRKAKLPAEAAALLE